MIPSSGPLDAKIVIIGDAPHTQDLIDNKPLTGYHGSILDMKLHRIGVTRQECYLTYLIKTKPLKASYGENHLEKYWIKKQPILELIQAKKELLEELEKVKCNVIIALGVNVLWALTGQTSIKKWRGSILECQLPSGRIVKVIGTYCPTSVIKEYELNPIFEYDIKKAVYESNSAVFIKGHKDLIIAPTFDDVLIYLNHASSLPAITFDIETTPQNITCVGIGVSKNMALCIPTIPSYWKSMSQLKQVLEGIHTLLVNPNIIKIGQNISYDIQYLMRIFGILPSKPWADTMFMQHACYSEMPKGLDFLTSIYTNEPYYKDDLKTWFMEKTDNQMLWTYNARDCVITFEVYEALIKEMKKLDTTSTYNYMMELLEPLLFMMTRGVLIDSNAVEDAKNILLKNITETELNLKEKTNGINLSSPKQLMQLANSLGVKAVMKKGKQTMDAKALEKMSKQHPFFHDIVQLRKDKKLVSTYLNTPVDPFDGRWKCSFNSTGTETGRLSSSESVFGTGTNLQNIPKHIRHIIIPDKDMMFTEADLKGAEAMIVAYLSNDIQLIKLFQEGKNIHNYTVKLIWDMTDEEIAQDKLDTPKGTLSKYDKGKRLRHSGNYLGSYITVQEQLGISASEAKNLLQRFYDSSPNLVNWHYKIETELKNTRTLTTPLGRKRIFFSRMDKTLIRSATAYIPQETCAHVLNLGMVNIYNNLCKNHKDIEILLTVHDSILIQHPTEKKDLIYSELPKLMKIDIPYDNGIFNIEIEMKSGSNWRDMK